MNFIHASMHLCILTALHLLPKDWILSVKHSNSVYWHIKIKLRVLLSYMDILPLVFLCLHQGPLRWNGHWFSFFTSRPSPMEWSLIFLLHIKALSDGMVIDFFVTSWSSPLECSSLFSSFDHDPFLWIGLCICLFCFFLFSFKTQTKLVFLSLLIFYFDNLWKLKFHTIK